MTACKCLKKACIVHNQALFDFFAPHAFTRDVLQMVQRLDIAPSWFVIFGVVKAARSSNTAKSIDSGAENNFVVEDFAGIRHLRLIRPNVVAMWIESRFQLPPA